MPFCADCDRFYNPNTLSPAGDCPDGHHVTDPDDRAATATVPWHFKLMLAFVVVYLGWRLVQFLGWVGTSIL